jgi:hypothetical protein
MPPRILVAGTIAGQPRGHAGLSWVFLQYVLGFRRLGCETYFFEEIPREVCVDDAGRPAAFADSVNARYFQSVIDRFGLHEHASLLERDGDGHVGLSRRDVARLAPDIDLSVDQFGAMGWVLPKVRRRMYVDMDPGYVQIWAEQYGADVGLAGHDVYVTVGLNLGEPDCPMPTAGVDWIRTLPPVVLDEWTTTRPPGEAYSTVASWRGFSEIEWAGQWYRQKSSGFEPLLDLPRRVPVPLELCLSIHPEDPDLPRLREHGWRIVSPYVHASDADTYRAYLEGARAEFAPAKHLYTAGRTGWFSDRTACYLALGRPVIVEETGLAPHVPVGEGLLTFSDRDEAIEAIARVEADYERHAVAARRFAREHLDSDHVLGRLLERAGF